MEKTCPEFKVTILTTSYWPSYKTYELTIPRQLEACVKAFNTYYQQKYNHRVLQWCYSLGTGMVQAQFPESQKQYDLVMGTYQMCILMMFNQKKAISFQEIKEAMKFDDDACTKNIRSFMIKQKILERQGESQSSTFHNDDLFVVNEKFTSQIKKVNLPIP